jgi:Ca-activated chloride channel family protein
MYNLLTENTSFVAVHEVVRNPEAQSQEVHQPLPLPLHVSNLAAGGSVSKVSEPELFTMLVIALLILIMAIAHKKYFRHHTRHFRSLFT